MDRTREPAVNEVLARAALHRPKYWHEKHGAEIYSLTADVLECVVSRPPATREAALALAREHFLFCSDIVHQGTESVELLAASLLNAEVWFFWWD